MSILPIQYCFRRSIMVYYLRRIDLAKLQFQKCETIMNRYLTFSGCATRSEFWGVFVVNMISCIILGTVAGMLMQTESELSYYTGIAMLLAIFVMTAWVTLATSIRRCRDAGINIFWTLAIFVPWISTIVFIVIGCLRSKIHNN